MPTKLKTLILPMLLMVATAWGQNQITGIVLDDRGQLVPNAEITTGQSKTKTDAEEGVNTQYLHSYKFFGHQMLLTLGSNYHDNQINVGLLHTKDREILDLTTS